MFCFLEAKHSPFGKRKGWLQPPFSAQFIWHTSIFKGQCGFAAKGGNEFGFYNDYRHQHWRRGFHRYSSDCDRLLKSAAGYGVYHLGTWEKAYPDRQIRLARSVLRAVPTNEFINVTVDGVANVKISSDPDLLKRAAESLLGMRQPELTSLVTQVLEGNMREIVGSVGLKEMVQDRQGVAKKITENVVPDMEKLGIEVVNFNIQSFKDGAGTIENMGIDNVEQIRKNAQIAKANAQRDIAIATSNAQQEANAVKVQADKMIAAQNAELAVQQAEMKVKADTKKAEADAAYSIQQENQRKTIEIARTNADIARKEKEAELAEKEIALKERQLDADIRKQADAMKYKAEKEAESELIRRQKEAEAKRFEAEQEALAKKAEAEANRFSMEQEAEGIRAKGLAEAQAIEKKAEAQKKMGEASVLEMYLTALPEVVKNAAAPLAQTDKIVMYGDGNSTKLVKDVMNSTSQIVDGVKESTGIDLQALLAGIAGGKLAAAQSQENAVAANGSVDNTKEV